MIPEIDCPLCAATVKQVASATLSLALWQHVNWVCPKGPDMRVGQARKRDVNEAIIVKTLEQYGAHVTRISGKGAPDILVKYRGDLFAFEVKSAKGKRTEAQCATEWPVIRSLDEALRAIGVTWV